MNDYLAGVPALIERLPTTDAVYRNASGVTFEVFVAKDFKSRFWRDPALKELLLCTRGSYGVYGVREPFDRYDTKASIYVARARYPHENGTDTIEEWLSSRLVPGVGDPAGAGELDLYSYQGHSMEYWVQKRLGCASDVFWEYVLSSSRMCGIHPYITGAKDLGDFGKVSVHGRALKHKFTAVCNAVIRAQFLIDNGYQFPYRVVTAIIREDLHKRGLQVVSQEQKLVPLYTTAHEFLGIPNSRAITLDKNVYAFEFPSYWLDVSQLTRVLEELKTEGKLSAEGLEYYLRGDFPFSFNTANLGALLTVPGTIHASLMTGEELRALVDTRVEAKPILRITDAKAWFQSYLRILDVSGVDIFAQHPELRTFLGEHAS